MKLANRKIAGRSFVLDYTNDAYRIDIKTKMELVWTQTRGKDAGRSDTEKYVASELPGELFQITWVEADGLDLSNVLDFENSTVTTHASMGRDVFVNPGELSEPDAG